MSLKLAILIATAIASIAPALAQGGGGGGAGDASAGASSSGMGGNNDTGNANGSQSRNQNQNQQGTNGPSNANAVHNAETGANTKPMDASSGVVSAPGVGVGHSANGKPIGTSGSGPGSPEEPIDARKLPK
jgi:hypothetical protein